MNTLICVVIIGIFFNELLNIFTDHALKVKLVMHHTEANDHWRREGIRVNVIGDAFSPKWTLTNVILFCDHDWRMGSEGTEEIQFLPQWSKIDKRHISYPSSIILQHKLSIYLLSLEYNLDRQLATSSSWQILSLSMKEPTASAIVFTGSSEITKMQEDAANMPNNRTSNRRWTRVSEDRWREIRENMS